MLNYITIQKFSELSGYSEDAIYQKKNSGIWPEGKVWLKADDGRILIIVSGFEEWVETGLGSRKRAKAVSKSNSHTRGFVVESVSNSSPQPLI